MFYILLDSILNQNHGAFPLSLYVKHK